MVQRTPVALAGGASPQLLSNLADFRRTTTPLSLNHCNVQPVFDVYQRQDTDPVRLEPHQSDRCEVPEADCQASSIVVRGRLQSMNQSFFQLGLGICFAVLLVYFLMVVNFQSWLTRSSS
jgi:multidrug efflux pump subunit AcrB